MGDYLAEIRGQLGLKPVPKEADYLSGIRQQLGLSEPQEEPQVPPHIRGIAEKLGVSLEPRPPSPSVEVLFEKKFGVPLREAEAPPQPRDSRRGRPHLSALERFLVGASSAAAGAMPYGTKLLQSQAARDLEAWVEEAERRHGLPPEKAQEILSQAPELTKRIAHQRLAIMGGETVDSWTGKAGQIVGGGAVTIPPLVIAGELAGPAAALGLMPIQSTFQPELVEATGGPPAEGTRLERAGHGLLTAGLALGGGLAGRQVAEALLPGASKAAAHLRSGIIGGTAGGAMALPSGDTKEIVLSTVLFGAPGLAGKASLSRRAQALRETERQSQVKRVIERLQALGEPGPRKGMELPEGAMEPLRKQLEAMRMAEVGITPGQRVGVEALDALISPPKPAPPLEQPSPSGYEILNLFKGLISQSKPAPPPEQPSPSGSEIRNLFKTAAYLVPGEGNPALPKEPPAPHPQAWENLTPEVTGRTAAYLVPGEGNPWENLTTEVTGRTAAYLVPGEGNPALKTAAEMSFKEPHPTQLEAARIVKVSPEQPSPSGYEILNLFKGLPPVKWPIPKEPPAPHPYAWENLTPERQLEIDARRRAAVEHLTDPNPETVAIARRDIQVGNDPKFNSMVTGRTAAYLVPGKGNPALKTAAEMSFKEPHPTQLEAARIVKVPMGRLGTFYLRPDHPLFAESGRTPRAVLFHAARNDKIGELLGYTEKARYPDGKTIVTTRDKAGKEIVSITTDDPMAEIKNQRKTVPETASAEVRANDPAGRLDVNAARFAEALRKLLEHPRGMRKKRAPREEGYEELRSGLTLKDIAEAAKAGGKLVAKTAKTLWTALRDPVKSRELDKAAQDKVKHFVGDLMEKMGGGRLAASMNLPPTDASLAAARKVREEYFEAVFTTANRIAHAYRNKTAKERTDFWRRTETDAPSAADKELHAIYRGGVESFGRALVEAGEAQKTGADQLKAELKAARDAGILKPGEARYRNVQRKIRAIRDALVLTEEARLRHMDPGSTVYVKRIAPRDPKKADSIWAKLQRLYRKTVQVEVEAQIGELHGEARAGTAIAKRRLKKRKDLTTEEAEEAGYITGLRPVLETLSEEGRLVSGLLEMRYVADDPTAKGRIWRDPVVADKSGEWEIAAGEGWGHLNGKEIHKDYYGTLELQAVPEESGFANFLVALGAWGKEKVTVQDAPRHQMKSALFENPLAAWGAGNSPVNILRRIDRVRDLARLIRDGKADDALQLIIDSGLFDMGAFVGEISEGSIRRSDLEFKNLRGPMKGYYRDFAAKFMENLAEHMEVSQKKFEGQSAIKRQWGRLGAITAALHSAAYNWMPTPGKKGWTGAGQRLRDVSSAIDLFYKYTTARELLETGGAGLLGKKRGLPREMVIEELRRWWDPNAMPPLLRGVVRSPFVPAFIRWPIKWSVNLAPATVGGGGAWKRRPGAAAAMVMTAVGAKELFKLVTGLSDDEIEEQKLQATSGDKEAARNLAPVWTWGDGKIEFADVQAIDLSSFWRSFPLLGRRVAEVPGENEAERFGRGVISSSPALSSLYETVTQKEDYNEEPLRRDWRDTAAWMVPGGQAAVPYARREERIERGKPYGAPESMYPERDLYLRHALGLGFKTGFPRGTEEGEAQAQRREAIDRKRRFIEYENLGGKLGDEPILPRERPEGMSDEDWNRLVEIWWLENWRRFR